MLISRWRTVLFVSALLASISADVSAQEALRPADFETLSFRLQQAEERLRMLEASSAPAVSNGGDSDAEDSRAVRPGDVFDPAPDAYQPPDIRTDESAPTSRLKSTRSSFDDAFRWATDDGEYELNLHSELQFDLRAYAQADSSPVDQTGFYIPRARFFFNGRITRPVEYSFSINNGLGSFELLDAYLNFNFDKRFQFRIGRYRMPFTYDWYALNNQFLIAPERSVWTINYAYRRNVAAMLHGEILDDSAEWALAVANGPRNAFVDFNGSKDVLGFFNIRPFMHVDELPALKHLNLGGSAAYGLQDQSPLPTAFRTSINLSDNPNAFQVAPSFLQLNPGVFERGPRQLWEVHTAYYYKGLSLLAAYEGGYNGYSPPGSGGSIRVPTYGYSIGGGYFVTGEEVERRTFVEPLSPFDPREGRRGTGAVELQSRFAVFSVGNEIFSQNIADGTLWTNRVSVVDVGVNWYWNRYLKWYFDWQHSIFASPVPYRPGKFQSTSDLFWLRCQLYF